VQGSRRDIPPKASTWNHELRRATQTTLLPSRVVVRIVTLRVTEPWPRLPREAVESPSLEIFKTCLAAVLCSLLWVTLLGQGAGLGDPQRALPTPAIP